MQTLQTKATLDQKFKVLICWSVTHYGYQDDA